MEKDKDKKMKRLIILIIPVIAILFTHCAKDNAGCITSTGKIIIQDRTGPAYHYVEVYNNINLILTQDSTNTGVKVEAGENIIDGISTEFNDGKLILRNNNSCNWVRSFDIPINVYLNFTRLDTLIFAAAGNVTCTNEWTSDSLFFNVIEGGGHANLKVNSFKTFLYVTYGTVTVNITGTSQVTFISSHGYGPVHAEDLHSKFTYMNTSSPNDVYLNATVELSAKITNIGNVYYSGDPPVVHTEILGGGKLIKF